MYKCLGKNLTLVGETTEDGYSDTQEVSASQWVERTGVPSWGL